MMRLNCINEKQKLLKGANAAVISVARAIFLIAFAFILIYPVLFMLCNAVKTQADVMNPAVTWLPHSPSLYSFKMAFLGMEYPRALLNTLKYSVVSALIEVAACAFYAYGISRFKLPINGLLMFFLILIIIVPDVVLVIPRIVNFRHMDFLGILGLLEKLTGKTLRPNLTDTVWTFYLPSIFGVGLKSGILIYIYMQFFKGLPKELEEAAWIDGAGPFRTFIQIIIPSCGVVILTVTIFSVVWHWNDWLLPTMYTSNNATLSSQLYDINMVVSRWARAQNITLNEELKYGIPLAACILFILPPVTMYLVLQRKFIQSIDRVGIVG